MTEMYKENNSLEDSFDMLFFKKIETLTTADTILLFQSMKWDTI